MSSPRALTGPLTAAQAQREAVALYGEIWRFVPSGIERARRWGSEWFAVTDPTRIVVDDRLVAHVGQTMVDLQLDGKRQRVAALHAVCVHPDYRGRGYGRLAMETALRRLDERGCRRVILWSEKLELYAKFGFRPIAEHVFACPAPSPAAVASRSLDPDDATDLAILRRLIAERTPISAGHAAADNGWHFLIDLGLANPKLGTLRYLPEHDAIVVGEASEDSPDDTLCVYDVIASRIPTLAEVVGAFREHRFSTIELHVSPDRLAPEAVAKPHPEIDRLLVRGDDLAPADGRPFAFSPFVRT